MARILWIDDNETTTTLVGEELEALGHEVEVLPFLSDGKPRLRPYDLIVLDLFVERTDRPGEPSTDLGLNYLLRLLEDRGLRNAVEKGATRFLLLSQHLAEYELREWIRGFTHEHDIRAYLRSKNEDVGPSNSRRQAIARVIASVADASVAPHLSDEVRRLLNSAGTEDFFEISLSKYRQLPDPIQAELQEDALTSVESDSGVHFSEDGSVDWLIFCGPTGLIASGPSSKLPSATERRAISQQYDHPVLVVTRPVPQLTSKNSMPTVEEIPFFGRPRRQVAQRCQGVMSDYPILSLRLAQADRTFHFDTGCDSNYLRASQVREHGIQLAIEDRIRLGSRFGKYYLYELPAGGVDCLLVDEGDMGHLGVRVDGFAIEQFRNWEYARRCHESACGVGKVGEVCPVRSGLIGRGFLGDNELAAELSPASERTQFRRI